jgi:hypothetical protein
MKIGAVAKPMMYERAVHLSMPKILDSGRFRVYVYANDAIVHNFPDSHV